MRLYLAQHGPATSKEENPDRPLTVAGMERVRRMASLLKKSGQVVPEEIRHSGKLRALQTAEALAVRMGLDVPIEPASNLGPLDDVAELAGELETTTSDLMLVGHLPHLSRLASRLVLGDAEREVFVFQQGSVLCLEREANEEGEGRWTVVWMVVPELLGD